MKDEDSGDRRLIAVTRSVRDILGDPSLRIPSYQRPYSWTVKNAVQLVEDIEQFRGARQYRVGTFIVHRHQDDEASRALLDIVDGQQRFITFALIAVVLAQLSPSEDQQKDLTQLTQNIRVPERFDGESARHMRENRAALERTLSAWGADTIQDFAHFFLHSCEIVQITVHELDGAFQMFDSQNTRGRPLFPTDLLKAYHLREMVRDGADEARVLSVVRRWEQISPVQIDHVISDIVFPIRRWTRRLPLPAAGFTAQDVDEFKGVRGGAMNDPDARWSHALLMASAYIDAYRQQNAALIHHRVLPDLEFPFLLDQPVMDGEMFFRMVLHYVERTESIGISPPRTGREERDVPQVDDAVRPVVEAFDAAVSGSGDRHARRLFDCLLLAYTDRFGKTDLQRASILLSKWALALRIALERVQALSVNSYALGEHDLHGRMEGNPQRNLFEELVSARSGGAFLSSIVPPSLPTTAPSGAQLDRHKRFHAVLQSFPAPSEQTTETSSAPVSSQHEEAPPT